MKRIEIAVLVMLWAVTLWRVPSAIRTVKQRALWVSIAGLTLSMTFRYPDVMDWVNARSGIPNVATLLKHVFGIIAAGAVVDFVIAISRPETDRRIRPRHLVGLTAVATMSVLFGFVPEHRVIEFYEENVGNVWASLYYAVFIVYLGYAMAVATWLFWDSARHASTRPLRVGVRLMGIGTAIGVLYAATRATYMVLRLTGLADSSSDSAADAVTDLCKYVSIGLILVGSSLPAFGVARRSLQDWRSHRDLQPLWRDLTTATPDIVLNAPLPRGPRVRLHRTVIELRDAALALAPYADEDLKERAGAAARTRVARDPEAAAEALWLKAAMENKARGAEPVTEAAPTSHQADDEEIAGADFDAEVARLLRLSEAFYSPDSDSALVSSVRQEQK
ncbi:MAB_1171c family putative transporter [Streptomyces sp. NPDC057638]|uniref:MAB_1171c family putative transporter n=1 Tax=Streptomyces sp. NPDC057638 TaxID=3346190 RepID=UPI00368E5F28